MYMLKPELTSVGGTVFIGLVVVSIRQDWFVNLLFHSMLMFCVITKVESKAPSSYLMETFGTKKCSIRKVLISSR